MVCNFIFLLNSLYNRCPLAGLDKAQLTRKIRLLSLASLGFQNIGNDLAYSKVASTLQVDVSEVEKWVIDGQSDPVDGPPFFFKLTVVA